MDSDTTALGLKYIRLWFQLIRDRIRLKYWKITSKSTLFRFVRYARHLKEFSELAIVTRTPDGAYSLSQTKPAHLSVLASDATIIQPASYREISQSLLQVIAEFADTLREFAHLVGGAPGFGALAAARSGIMLGNGRIRSFDQPFNGLFINPFSAVFSTYKTPMEVAQELLNVVKKAAIMHVTPSGDTQTEAQRWRDLDSRLAAAGDAARIRTEFHEILQRHWELYREAAIL